MHELEESKSRGRAVTLGRQRSVLEEKQAARGQGRGASKLNRERVFSAPLQMKQKDSRG